MFRGVVFRSSLQRMRDVVSTLAGESTLHHTLEACAAQWDERTVDAVFTLVRHREVRSDVSPTDLVA